MFAEVVTIN